MNSSMQFAPGWPTVEKLQEGGFLSRKGPDDRDMLYALIFDNAKALLEEQRPGGNTTLMADTEIGVQNVATFVFGFPVGTKLYIARVYPYGTVRAVDEGYISYYEGCVHCKGKEIIPSMGGDRIPWLCYWDPEDEYGIREFIV